MTSAIRQRPHDPTAATRARGVDIAEVVSSLRVARELSDSEVAQPEARVELPTSRRGRTAPTRGH